MLQCFVVRLTQSEPKLVASEGLNCCSEYAADCVIINYGNNETTNTNNVGWEEIENRMIFHFTTYINIIIHIIIHLQCTKS